MRHTYVVAISAGALAMAGCGSESAEEVSVDTAAEAPAASPDVIGADGEAFWTSLYQEAEYVEQHESLTAMGEASDLVVVARPADFEVGTVIEDEEAPEGSVVFGFMRLQDVDVIAGELRADSVQVAFWMPGRPENAREAVAEADSSLPQAPALFFLRETDDSGPTVYRLVNGNGLWIHTADGFAVPLSVQGADLAMLSEADAAADLTALAQQATEP
ncbi:MAG: hypothetical protein M3520_05410 [Actinomycetota bacterium]|nr:hypothetical protein [Actinomycetota bacterium]